MQALIVWFGRAVCALLLVGVAGLARAQAVAPVGEDLARHVLDRLGYGPAPGDLARVRTMGVQAHVDRQLAPPPMPPWLAARLSEMAGAGALPGDEALLRAIASPRQLEEVLAAFWLNHFRLAGSEPHAALRPQVLGRYAGLRAVAERYAHKQARALPGGERAALRALVRHFVVHPSARLEASLLRIWRQTGGEQRAVLRALLTSSEFLAPAEWKAKRKDDFRFVVSAVRASNLAVREVAPLAQYLRAPMGKGERTEFVERLAGGRLALAAAPSPAHRHASSSPPPRATVDDDLSQGAVAQPGPVSMEAPTPSAAAMARARNRPDSPDRLRQLLSSEDFLHY